MHKQLPVQGVVEIQQKEFQKVVDKGVERHYN
jgi:hypothetical protein